LIADDRLGRPEQFSSSGAGAPGGIFIFGFQIPRTKKLSFVIPVRRDTARRGAVDIESRYLRAQYFSHHQQVADFVQIYLI